MNYIEIKDWTGKYHLKKIEGYGKPLRSPPTDSSMLLLSIYLRICFTIYTVLTILTQILFVYKYI